MSVLSVHEIPERRQANIDGNGVRTYTKAWRVEFDSPIYAGITAILNVPVAHYQSYSEEDYEDPAALALVPRAYPENPPDSFAWIVEIDYSTSIWDEITKRLNSGGIGSTGARPGGSGGGGDPGSDPNSPQNPLNWPAKISFGKAKRREAFEKDINDAIVANSAGDKFDPAPERDVTDRTITIVKNQIVTPATVTIFDSFFDKVNSDTFLNIYPAGSVKCEGITCESDFQNEVYFWVVTYEFTVILNPKPALPSGHDWELAPLDAGFHKLDGDGNRVHITDHRGTNVSQPVLLDGTGGELATDGTPVYCDGTGSAPGPFKQYETAAFSVLGLP